MNEATNEALKAFPFDSGAGFGYNTDLDAANEELFDEISQVEDEFLQLGGSQFSEASDSESWLNFVPHMSGFAEY